MSGGLDGGCNASKDISGSLSALSGVAALASVMQRTNLG